MTTTINADRMAEITVRLNELRNTQHKQLVSELGPIVRERIHGFFLSSVGLSCVHITMPDFPDALVFEVLKPYIWECNKESKKYEYILLPMAKALTSENEFWETYGSTFRIHIEQRSHQ